MKVKVDFAGQGVNSGEKGAAALAVFLKFFVNPKLPNEKYQVKKVEGRGLWVVGCGSWVVGRGVVGVEGVIVLSVQGMFYTPHLLTSTAI